MTTAILKLFIEDGEKEGDVRRFEVAPSELKLDHVRGFVGDRSVNLFCYVDDEKDVVTVGSDEELRDAFSECGENKQGKKVLKLRAKMVKPIKDSTPVDVEADAFITSSSGEDVKAEDEAAIGMASAIESADIEKLDEDQRVKLAFARELFKQNGVRVLFVTPGRFQERGKNQEKFRKLREAMQRQSIHVIGPWMVRRLASAERGEIASFVQERVLKLKKQAVQQSAKAKVRDVKDLKKAKKWLVDADEKAALKAQVAEAKAAIKLAAQREIEALEQAYGAAAKVTDDESSENDDAELNAAKEEFERSKAQLLAARERFVKARQAKKAKKVQAKAQANGGNGKQQRGPPAWVGGKGYAFPLFARGLFADRKQ